MGEHNVDNPLYDMGNAVVELYKVADMAEIIIEARSGEGEVILQFSNHGGTIPKEKLEHIFEQFYRLVPRRIRS